MFQFEHPEYLHALWSIPILLLAFWWGQQQRRKRLNALGKAETVALLMPGFSFSRIRLKAGLLLFSIAALSIAWANPQWGSRKVSTEGKSADVFIALDISRSMLAEDVQPNRLQRAKKFAERLIENLAGDRIGLIVFAGGAFVQMPLSTDYDLAQLLLHTANTDMTDRQGTAIADAINIALESYDADSEHARALVIISDGETHDEETLQLARKAAKDGLVIVTVGVGTTKGARIPLEGQRGRRAYLTDENGRPVISKLEEKNLRKIAETARGAFFLLAGNTDEIARKTAEKLRKLERKVKEQRSYTERKSYFHIFVLLACFSLVLHLMFPNRKEPG